MSRSRIGELQEKEERRFVDARPKSSALFQRAKKSLLAGVPMNWMMKWAGPFPVFVANANGAHITDVDGHECVDFCLGDTGAMYGHSPKIVADMIKTQADNEITMMLPTEDSVLVSEKWHVDETAINVTGENRYLWNVTDSETRMLLATHISKSRSMADTRAPLRKVKGATETKPMEILSDGMQAYPKAIRRELGKGRKSPHKVVPSIRAEESNNRIERLHGTEKSRTKVMRAFDQDHGAATLMDGFRVHYDMVRVHQALGKTPAEAADIAPLVGFKWLEQLKLAILEKEQ